MSAHPAYIPGELTRREVLERLCRLQEEVAEHFRHRHPSDCFCGGGGLWMVPEYGDHRYRNNGVVLGFIERVVRAAIAGQEAAFPREERTEIADALEALAERMRVPRVR